MKKKKQTNIDKNQHLQASNKRKETKQSNDQKEGQFQQFHRNFTEKTHSNFIKKITAISTENI